MKKNTLIGLFILSDMFATGIFTYAFLRRNGDGSPFSDPLIYVALAMFILVPIVLLVLYLQSAKGSGTELLKTGQPALATVLEVWEIGVGTKNGLAQVGLKLRVDPPDGSSYETKTSVTRSALNPDAYRAGMMLHVRFAPKNPKRVVIDDGSAANLAASAAPGGSDFQRSTSVSANLQTPPAGQGMQGMQFDLSAFNVPPEVQKRVLAALADNDHNGIPDIMEKDGKLNSSSAQGFNLSGKIIDPQARIEKLEQLRAAGAITQQQFDMLRSLLEQKPH